jgi:hypothetical protein
MSFECEANRKKILKLKRNANNKCADCSNTGTTYIDIKFGCFLCTRCAGLHRKLGTDISRIKSISFDTFKDVDVVFIKSVGGNDKFNNIYEAKPISSSPKITSESNDNTSYDYIVKKYVKKIFFDESKKPEIKRELVASKITTQNKLIPVRDTKDDARGISIGNIIDPLNNKLTHEVPEAIRPAHDTSDIMSDLIDLFGTPAKRNENPITPFDIFDTPPQKVTVDNAPKLPPKKSYDDIKQDIMKMYSVRY